MIRRLLPALVCFALLAHGAAAHLISKPPCATPNTPSPTLQQILDGLVVSGPAIDAGAPQSIELWDNASGPMTANVVVNYTGSDAIRFGMYPDGDPSNHAFLLSGDMSPSVVVSVSFADDGKITISGGEHSTWVAGFGGPFGFFVKVPSEHGESQHGESQHDEWEDGGTQAGESSVYLFTDADLNGGVRAKVFQGNGTTTLKFPGQSPGLFLVNQYLIAFETGDDGGFNDFVVSVSNLVAVPEPAIAWLLGLSALAVLSARRIRST